MKSAAKDAGTPSVSHQDDKEDSAAHERPMDGLGSSRLGLLSDVIGKPSTRDNRGNEPVGFQQSVVKNPDFKDKIFRSRLYMDSSFPLGGLAREPLVRWKRPKEIHPAPMFIVGGATRMDVCQGALNDCWFLSALASLSLHPSLLEKVVPPGQSFQTGYNGSFLFRFWQYGKWIDMKIDDLLPTKDGRLIFLSSPETNEFWSALLEKAYAKLKGGYTALNMGFPHEAMVDMTGGVTEVMTISRLHGDLLAALRPLLLRGALINCANCNGELEKKNRYGIMFRHAYSVTSLEKVQTKYGPVDLIRIHNPWGTQSGRGLGVTMGKIEWSGVSPEDQKRLQRIQKEDGEFWMSVPDFRENFETMEVCHLSADTLCHSDGTLHPWHLTMHRGNWMPGGRYWHNPQFKLTLLEEDEDPCNSKRTCSFLVALMQKHQRSDGPPPAIRLDIYLASSMSKFLSSQDISTPRPILSTSEYLPLREVVIRDCLAPGHYFLVPAIQEPNPGGEFLLRVLTEKGNAFLPTEQPGMDPDVIHDSPHPHLSALPKPGEILELFKKHCNRKGQCKALELHNLLSEAFQVGVLAGTEKKLSLEHCKSFVVLMDSQGLAQLDAQGFQVFWDKIRNWTDIFLRFDKNKSQALEYEEVPPALRAAGLKVDDFILQLIGLRYTEPDMTVSYPGFLFLLMKLESMIHKFKIYDVVGMGTVSVNYRQWLHMTMYN